MNLKGDIKKKESLDLVKENKNNLEDTGIELSDDVLDEVSGGIRRVEDKKFILRR